MTNKEQPPKTNTEKEEIQKEIKRQEESQKAMIKALIGLGASDEQINKMCEAAGIKREDLEDGKKVEKKDEPKKPAEKDGESSPGPEEKESQVKKPVDRKLTTQKAEELIAQKNRSTKTGKKPGVSEIPKENPKEKTEETKTKPSSPEKAKEPGEKPAEIKKEGPSLDKKEAEKMLTKIKIDKNKIETRKKELVAQGISEALANKISETEEIVTTCLARIDILNKVPDIKDGEKRLKSAQDKLEEEKENLETLITTKEQELQDKEAKLKNVLSDLQEVIKGLRETGKTDAEIEELLKNKNVPEEEINKILGKETKKEKTEIPEPEKTTPESQGAKPAVTTPETTQTKIQQTKQDIQTIIQNAESERTANITPEQLFNKLSDVEKIHESKIESSKVIKAFDKWEKYGKGEKGWKGFGKRMTKNVINLALVGAVSSVAVDQLAQAGIGSATALAGGVTSNILKKIGMGLAFGTAFEGVNAVHSDNKYVNGFKKALPYLISVGAIGVSVAGGAGAVGAVSAFGIFASKIFKGSFTKEKIEERQGKAKDRLLAEIKAKGETINPRDAEKLEKKMDKIFKKYERQRIYGRVIDGIARLTLASTISTVTLEVSGIMHDHHAQNNVEDSGKNTENNTDNQKTETKISDSTQDDKTETNTTNIGKPATPDTVIHHNQQTPDTTNNTPDNHNNVTDNNTQQTGDVKTPETNTSMNDILVHKGEGIEHSFIRQIEHNHELAKELGYKGDFNDAQALHEFAGHQAHVIAMKEGYVDGQGNEIRIAEADKVGYEIKMENDHVSVVEKTPTGDVIETHHEGDKFEDQTERNEYVKEYHHEQTPSTNEVEQTTPVESGDTNNIPEQQIDPETGEKIDLSNIQETPQVSDTNNFKVPEQVDAKEADHNLTGDQNGVTDGQKSTPGPEIVQNGLTQIQLDEVHNTFNNNIDHLFYEKPNGMWEHIQKNISAERIFELAKKNEINSDFKPLVEHMEKLESLTNIHPYTKDILHPDGPETIPHFMGRALEEASKKGLLDEVTL